MGWFLPDNEIQRNAPDEQLRFNKIASISALISAVAVMLGILIGGYGVYLGIQSIKLTKEIESYRFRPHLSTNWNFLDGSKSLLNVTNHGPGIAIIKSVKVWRDSKDDAVDLVFYGQPEHQKLGNKAFMHFVGQELALQLTTPNQYFVWLFDGDTPLGINETRSILYKGDEELIYESTEKRWLKMALRLL